jgi:CheY-like chemotaxis protein
LNDLREMLAHTVGAEIAVRRELARPEPHKLRADKGQLETVLVNLATNARDAMPHGGTLTLSACDDIIVAKAGAPDGGGILAPGRYVRLSVSDTGEGMTPEVLARAAEPFFTTKAHGKGTGLGLAMARGFAEQSGGALAIQSAPGAGTTVTVWLPAAAADAGAGEAPAPVPPGHAARRILVVDDEALVREVVAEGLAELGFSTLRAADGATALAMLDAGAALDLLLTDHAMPGMDGVTLVREARRRRPDLPAILLTGNADSQVETKLTLEGLVSGAFSLLRKPVSAEQLAERIEALLERTSAVRRSVAGRHEEESASS